MPLPQVHVRLLAAMMFSAVQSLFSASHAEDLQMQQAALSMITKTANEICQSAPLETTSQGVGLSGSAAAKLSGLIGHVADLGITGAGEYQTSRSMGVLQKDLVTAIRSGNDCKLEVFRTLEKKLLSGTSAPQSTNSPSPPAVAAGPKPQTATPVPMPVNRQLACVNYCGPHDDPLETVQITVTSFTFDTAQHQTLMRLSLDPQSSSSNCSFSDGLSFQDETGKTYQPGGQLKDGGSFSLVKGQQQRLGAIYAFIPSAGSTYTLRPGRIFCIGGSLGTYGDAQFTF